jgi:dephospho-CoA kinase
MGKFFAGKEMIIIGLTGGIGSGKSYVARLFIELGIPVFHSDQIAITAYSSPPIRERILDLLGPDAYSGETINRNAIAQKIFNSADLLSRLNQIIHPWVEQEFIKWADNLSAHPYLMKESAILFEAGLAQKMDKIICVHSPDEIRIKRVITRDQSSRADIIKRMDSQWPQDKKMAMADFLIDNDGTKLVLPQILDIHERIIKEWENSVNG